MRLHLPYKQGRSLALESACQRGRVDSDRNLDMKARTTSAKGENDKKTGELFRYPQHAQKQ